MSQALIIIDCQVDFAAPDGAMAKLGFDVSTALPAVEKAGTLAQAARAAGVPVIFARFVSAAGICVEGTRGAEFVGPEPRLGEHVVTKTLFSAFTRTGLADYLRARSIDTVVLAGLTTECCVGSSAWAAFEEGFKVVVVADACAAYEDDLHRVTLKSLALSEAVIADSAQVTASWK
jgi:ureidoacrylate peracid hydrolase